MAKIEYHKPRNELPETKRIDSIVGQEYLKNYKTRMEQAAKIMQENGKTRIKAEDIVIGKFDVDE